MSKEEFRQHIGRKTGGKKFKKHKYNAKPKVVNGIRFDSTSEADRYLKLLWLEAAGEIKNLRLQVEYELIVNGTLVTSYFADFVYELATTGVQVVEDVKGYRTKEYKIKKLLMKALFNIDVYEYQGTGRRSNKLRGGNDGRVTARNSTGERNESNGD